MSYRVQFTISDDEFKRLEIEATKKGFPNIAELCKTRSLEGNNNYTDLYIKMVGEIEKMEVGNKFYLRDLIENPPALLGRWLFDNVKNGKIRNVKHLGNDGTNPERYEKI